MAHREEVEKCINNEDIIGNKLSFHGNAVFFGFIIKYLDGHSLDVSVFADSPFSASFDQMSTENNRLYKCLNLNGEQEVG